MNKTLLIFAAITVLSANSSWAASTHADWDAQNEEGRCWASTHPKSINGEIAGRQDQYLSIINYPSEGVRNSIAVVAGYQGAGEGEATFTIDGKDYEALPYGNAAFAASGTPEAELIAAMRRGKEFAVKWTSKDGQTSTDTYSLIGFNDAKSAIDRDCR